MPGPALSDRDLAVLRSFARRIDPSDAGAHNNLGVLYYQKGMVGEAVAAFSRALEIDSRMQVAQDNLELAYRESGFYDGRVAELQERLRRTPDDREARWELGRAYASLSRHDLAAQAFEELLARHASDVPALIHLGLAEKARGRIEAARRVVRAAPRELDPGSAVARFYQGETLYNRGLNDAALEALEAAIRHNPDYAEAHYLLAFVYGDMGLHERALEATKRAIALNPMLSRAPRRTSRSSGWCRRARKREGGKAGRAGGAATMPAGSRWSGTRSRTTSSGSPSGRSATSPRRCASTAWRSTRARIARSCCRRWRRCTCCAAIMRRRSSSTTSCCGRTRASPKLWNERGVCLHQAGRRDEARDRVRACHRRRSARTPWHGTTSACFGPAHPAPRPRWPRFASALERQRGLHAARLNLALVLMQRRQPQAALEAYREVLSRDHAQRGRVERRRASC